MTLPRDLNASAYATSSLRRELDVPLPILLSSSGDRVKRVQECLCLAGFDLVIDGAFGPATRNQLIAFQRSAGMPATGTYDVLEHDALSETFTRPLQAPAARYTTLSEAIIGVAKKHVLERPREVGGQNRGPWVRMYMNGNDGASYLWCAGFCFFILQQACKQFGSNPPLDATFSVNVLVERAKHMHLFVRGEDVEPTGHRQVGPGSFFVVRAAGGTWSHVGIVVSHEGDVIRTIEGNTNDDGSANGYEAIERVRGLSGKDFVCWS